MKILIMGLPGSGKTWLAERLQRELDCAWFNADEIRKMSNDWEFGDEARIRQARRMCNLADYEKSCGHTVICDFVCPTELTRYVFDADILIWMDTIKESRFADTNRIFQPPLEEWDIRLDRFESDDSVKEIARVLQEEYGVY